MPLLERILAPVAVTLLHVVLVAVVVHHCEYMLDPKRTITILEWFLVTFTAAIYYRTVIADPGVLRLPKTLGTTSSEEARASVLGATGVPSAVRRGKGAAARDARDRQDPQLFGRAALDAVSEFEDPGEETIELIDLENSSGCSRRDGSSVAPSAAHKVQDFRFCKTCSIYQPLRAKHCRDCGHCVRTHDHHCPWIGTCVGEGNRFYFFWFLMFQHAELSVFWLEGAVFLKDIDLGLWVSTYPILVLGLTVIGLLIIMVGCLATCHIYLVLTNLTTWESISWHRITYLQNLESEVSPFSRSVLSNIAAYCCLPWRPKPCASYGVSRNEEGWAIWEIGVP